jgi:cyclopropane fatty-acyl-phospholipid synthase-like methyltransferase
MQHMEASFDRLVSIEMIEAVQSPLPPVLTGHVSSLLPY